MKSGNHCEGVENIEERAQRLMLPGVVKVWNRHKDGFDSRMRYHSTSSSGLALVFEDLKMAEGVVSEPFLPSGDQGHKGGFATIQKQASFN